MVQLKCEDLPVPSLDVPVAGIEFAAPVDNEALATLLGVALPAAGNSEGLNAALPGLYDELRGIAASYLRHERPDHTLQPTALVHESYLRLLSQRTVDWSNRLHFLSVAARMMRRILCNYASARKASKRNTGEALLELDAALETFDRDQFKIAKVEEALRALESLDPRQARVVELRFFGGLTIGETAELLGVSAKTVQRDWMTARLWLQREIDLANATSFRS
ncbi:MAG TPA: ECF-type sigma factor [Chthoniobacterales bacterium]|jgi:RNA polymerase sigma factor (TIGR02999 family)